MFPVRLSGLRVESKELGVSEWRLRLVRDRGALELVSRSGR